MRSIILVAGLFAGAYFSANGQVLQLGGQYWDMKPSGNLSVGRDGRTGTRVDVGNDLGFRSREQVLGFDLVLGSGNEIALSYLDAELSANSRFSTPVEFGGTSFPTSASIHSELEANLLRLAYRCQSGSHGFRGGFLAGIQRASMDAKAAASRIGTGSCVTSATPPVVGVNVRIDPSPLFRIDAYIVGGGVWDWDKTNIALWDATASLCVDIRPFVVGIGYRQISLDAEDGGLPIEAAIRFNGPFLDAGLLL